MLPRNAGPAILGRMTAATILVLAGSQACGLFDDGTCTTENPPSIQVDVVDAGSERPVPHGANPMGLVIHEGVREPMFLQPAFPDAPTQLSGGDPPPGVRSAVLVYDVEITADGYATWRANGVSVEVNNCGQARTVELTARLMPLTPTA